MPKPTIHPRPFISLEDTINRSAMNKSIIELRASDVIESTNVAGEGGFVFFIELLVNVAKGFQEIQHDSCWSTNDSAVQQGGLRERLLIFRKASNLIS